MYEGLATHTESLYAENQSPDYSFGSFGLPPTTRPLDEVDSIDDLLDAVTYNRGALLYHALRLEIGDEAFFATLWEFIQSNLHGTAEIDDLQAVAEEMADADLGQFFTSWVSEAVVPDLPPAAG
jgi:aminopeptidase N